MTDEIQTTAAVLESMSEVRCPLYRQKREVNGNNDGYISRGYSISVSNDGVTFSEEDVLVIYDSTCVKCSVDESLTPTCVVQVCIVQCILYYNIICIVC